LTVSEISTPTVDDEPRQNPLEAEVEGISTEHIIILEDEKLPRGDGQKRKKRRSGSIGPRQATLDTFSAKPGTQSDVAESKPTDSLNGHGAVNATADALEGDLNYGRRKRQRTVSPQVDASDNGLVGHHHPIAEARDDSGLGITSSWDAQLRLKTEKGAEAQLNAGKIQLENEGLISAVPTKPKSAAEQDPAVLPLEEVQALEQARHSSTPRSIFEGTKWTPELSKPPSDEDSKPSSKSSCNSQHSGYTYTDSPSKAPPLPPAPKPSKMLQLKGGKLASPKAKKPQAEPEPEPQAKPKPKRGRKPATKHAIIIIKYPVTTTDRPVFGTKIDGILNGLEIFRLSVTKPLPTPKKEPPQNPSAPTHPFFMGKAALKSAVPSSMPEAVPEPTLVLKSPSRKIAGTPGKIRAQAQAHRATMNPPPTFAHVFGSSQSRMTKYAGTREAPWPWRGAVHVRGEVIDLATRDQQSFPETQRKLKRATVMVDDAENLIRRCSQDLKSSQITHTLRKPERVVTTGPGIQRRVAQELHTRFEQVTSENESDGPSARKRPSRALPHPALISVYSSIETNLTPFDKFECETQAWTQKYAPKSALEVLQTGKEAVILRDWLKSTTITAVDTGTNRSTTGSIKPSKPEKKKKRKRAADLDDFIISSDDELAGTAELEELEHDDPMQERSPQKRSLVRGGPETAHLPKAGNAVLLSGPNGCGKTAAVYAVAKELGFEVFELNSGSRRSGKDVLDKIGDMTENHLVQQVTKALSDVKPIADGNSMNVVDSDAPDPKQGSMTSFFKPTAVQKKAISKPTGKPQNDEKPPKIDTRPRPRQQRQSLILLEEVDVLFEEDKLFWMTVLTLAGHSKRPIVMTCNDESRLPLNALSLHALLRFTPPPFDIAVDYLLLIAAREGHLLQRSAIQSLYQSRSYDLRGSIMELDHWCQIGVGDTTGGFAWMLDRYPPGVDVNDDGLTLRVTSKDTYLSGMGVLSHDLVSSLGHTVFVSDEELLLEARERWNLNAEDLLLPNSNLDEARIVLDSDRATSSPVSLSDFERQCEINSAYDVSCGLGLRSGYDVRIDTARFYNFD
jgi:DNA polymerase III delta prime subunit